DAAFALDRGVERDEEIRDLSLKENRILVTRDRDLATRTQDAILLTSKSIEGQLEELESLGFDVSLEPRSPRCSACNDVLKRVSEAEDTPDDAPDPDSQVVWLCETCESFYWKGSHWESVQDRLPT
ncbi:MAG: Mut7-C RNAse domain-containing protein, partial [Halobacteriaceae archaeon]